MTTKPNSKRPVTGEIRQSQILTTFGPGSMVDLPNQSVLIGGLNYWRGYQNQLLTEERLEAKVAKLLGVKQVKLYTPPAIEQDPSKPATGITSFIFPTWFVAQTEQLITIKGKEYQTRPLIPWNRLVKGKYLSDTKKKYPVVPVRFVQGCPNGHISDIDWYKFVNPDCQRNCPAQLYLDEGGAGNNFADIFVRCEKCQKRVPLASATLADRPTLGYCRGDRPWLGKNAREECKVKDSDKPERNRLLVRSASNAYFPQILSVISLPDADSRLKEAVNSVFEDFLQYAEELDDITRDRRKQKVANALEEFSDEAVWEEVQRRKTGTTQTPKSIKQVELDTLLSCETTIGEDTPESDFYATQRSLNTLPQILEGVLTKIVLVHRLREVMALVGFTRFEAELTDIDGELSLEVRRAALDIEPIWTPAIENKGEGIFLSFNPEAIATWVKQDAVQKRGKQLLIGFEKWKQQRGLKKDETPFPGLPYILLHSLSHLLITSISLECGYAASSLKERIYTSETGYGILLYTGTTGSEGTLGGLIEVGKQIEHFLVKALELGRLCSNDPVCSQHRPDQEQEDRLLHGCACHGCLLIAETSCERHNQFLDRALVIETLGQYNASFFADLV